jgi:hypothetical protein
MISDKPGRRISLTTLVDRDRAMVQIIRRLYNTSGCMTDSGNMGWMPLSEWRAFLDEQRTAASDKQPLLVDVFAPEASKSEVHS